MSQVIWPPGLPGSPLAELSSRFGFAAFAFAASSEKLSPFTAGVPLAAELFDELKGSSGEVELNATYDYVAAGVMMRVFSVNVLLSITEM